MLPDVLVIRVHSSKGLAGSQQMIHPTAAFGENKAVKFNMKLKLVDDGQEHPRRHLSSFGMVRPGQNFISADPSGGEIKK